MLEVQLLDEYDTPIATSRRPATIKYKSSLLQKLRVLVLAPFLLGDVLSESQHLYLQMFDHFEEQQHMPFTKARVTLSSRDVRVYSASIGVTAQLQGIRYYMFHWYYTTAFAFILCIAAVEAAVVSAMVLVSQEDDDEEGSEDGAYHDPADAIFGSPATVVRATKVEDAKEPDAGTGTGDVLLGRGSTDPAKTTQATQARTPTRVKGEEETKRSPASMLKPRPGAKGRSEADAEPIPKPTTPTRPAVVQLSELQADEAIDIRANKPERTGLLSSSASPYRGGVDGGYSSKSPGGGLLLGRRAEDR
mmetsp:Transcript_19509/g.59013  ORF Transcript_19509/g.59013 Transcript_19509/m.59013 type:complete len:305 (+) Transcript_19509:134-1048(+)